MFEDFFLFCSITAACHYNTMLKHKVNKDTNPYFFKNRELNIFFSPLKCLEIENS